MTGEFEHKIESQPKTSKKRRSTSLTLEKAVEMGEYSPSFLSTFPEWTTFTNYIRWNYIRKAIQNRRRFLLQNWAETNNVLDFSIKPEMKQVLDEINNQLVKLNQEEEKLRMEYIK